MTFAPHFLRRFPHMAALARSRSLLAIALASAAAACGDAPVFTPAPAEAPAVQHATYSSYIGTAKLLHRDRSLAADEVDSVLVHPLRKTTLNLQASGLRIEIPKYAVTQETWVKAVSRRGPKIYYEFYPSPFRFQAPLRITQDLRETKAYQDKATASELAGAYLPLGEGDIAGDGTAAIGEIFRTELIPEQNKSFTRFAVYYTDHFSGYILAVGFKRNGE